jgi:hypothetical protein
LWDTLLATSRISVYNFLKFVNIIFEFFNVQGALVLGSQKDFPTHICVNIGLLFKDVNRFHAESHSYFFLKYTRTVHLLYVKGQITRKMMQKETCSAKI